MSIITTLEDLDALYGVPAEASLVKEVDRITPHDRALIDASPFAVLATGGAEYDRTWCGRARQTLW